MGVLLTLELLTVKGAESLCVLFGSSFSLGLLSHPSCLPSGLCCHAPPRDTALALWLAGSWPSFRSAPAVCCYLHCSMRARENRNLCHPVLLDPSIESLAHSRCSRVFAERTTTDAHSVVRAHVGGRQSMSLSPPSTLSKNQRKRNTLE